MTAFYTCKSDLHTYILNSACKISIAMLLHRLLGSSVHTSPITRAMPVTVVKMNTENIVNLNLSIEISYPAALTYQIPGFYLFQKYCFTSDLSSIFGILAIFFHHMHVKAASWNLQIFAIHIHEVHPL